MKRIAILALLPLCVVTRARAAENRPPQFSYDAEEHRRVHAGEVLSISLEGHDPEDDPLTFTCRGLPPGAHTRAVGKTSLSITWKTGTNEHGTWEVECDVFDGHAAATKYLRIEVEDDWSTYFMPGASFTMLQPIDRAAWGTFSGVSTEILIASWIHRNDNRGPSHGRVYLDMDILRSSRADTAAAFDLSMGFDLSIERNPSRKWLLPYFGLRGGAFLQKDLEEKRKTVWHLSPLAGAYLWADKNYFVTASAGYMLPISAARFDDLRGLRAQVGMNLSLW